MILTIFFLFGFVQYVSTIKCYTCDAQGFFCPLPFSLDSGEEHNENDIGSLDYDSHYICQSDHYIDKKTGEEKLILRGTLDCEELDIVNHRIHCCEKDNCNGWLPPMTRQLFMYSNNQQDLPSMILIILSVIFQYYFYW